MFNNKYGVFGMPVKSSSVTASQPPLAPPTAGSAVQGPEPGGIGTYPAMAGGGVMPTLTSRPRVSTQSTPWQAPSFTGGGQGTPGQPSTGGPAPGMYSIPWSSRGGGGRMGLYNRDGTPHVYDAGGMAPPAQNQRTFTQGFADGGVMDDRNVDQPLDDQVADTSGYTLDMDKVLQAAQEAVRYTRQQHGIPSEAFGSSQGALNGALNAISKQNAGPTLDANLQTEQAQSPAPQTDPEESTGAYAEGGEVEQGDNVPESGGVIPPTPQGGGQGQPDQQTAVRGYILGAGAMPPEEIMALEQQADPQGGMDPAEKKSRAIAMAGTPDKMSAALQHYRQKFNFGSAIARAAVAKGDLAGAARHATQAYTNVPNGKSIRFMPTQGGLALSVRPLTAGGNKPQAPAQSFDEGGEVLDDPYQYNQTAEDPDSIDQYTINAQAQQQQPQTVEISPQRLEELLGDYDKALDPNFDPVEYYMKNQGAVDQGMSGAQGAPQEEDKAQGIIGPPNPLKDPVDYYNENKSTVDKGFAGTNAAAGPGSEGVMSNAVQPDANPENAPPYKVAQAGPGLVQSPHNATEGESQWKPRQKTELDKRANQIFPWASQTKERNAYIQKMEEQQLKNKGVLDVAGAKGTSAEERAKTVGDTKAAILAETEAGKDRRQGVALGSKEGIAAGNRASHEQSNAQKQLETLKRSLIQNMPSLARDPKKLDELARKISADTAQQATPPQGQQQGAAPQGQKPIPPAAVQKLKELSPGGQVTPQIRSKFDAIFGPGATDRALAGR